MAQGSCVNTRRDVSALSMGLSASDSVPGKSRAEPNWDPAWVLRELGSGADQSSDPAGPYGWDGMRKLCLNNANGEAIKIDGAGVWESSDIFLVIASFLLCVVFVSKTLK